MPGGAIYRLNTYLLSTYTFLLNNFAKETITYGLVSVYLCNYLCKIKVKTNTNKADSCFNLSECLNFLLQGRVSESSILLSIRPQYTLFPECVRDRTLSQNMVS